MKENIKYQFLITTQAGQSLAFPDNTNNLNITWEKEPNAAKFRKKLQGKIKFVNEDFNKLYTQEKSIYRCNPITLLINRNCGGFTEYYNAQILCDNGAWDVDHCEVEIEASVMDDYTCYDDGKDTEVNLFSVVSSAEEVNTLKGTIETMSCFFNGYPAVDWCGDGDPYDQGWEILSVDATQDAPSESGPGDINQTIVWIRERLETITPQPAPWIEISAIPDGLVTNYVFVRAPILYDKVSNNGVRHIQYSWKYGAHFQNGFKLYDVISYFVNSMCPDLGIKSDFFQWNPDNESDINYVTGEQSKVLNLILFQKSDVKRPPSQSDIDNGFAADDAASIANITFDAIFQDILNTFKLQWWIEDGYLRIEHPKYFDQILGIDLTLPRSDSPLRSGKNTYNYATDGLPRKEIFTWMDKSLPGTDFAGQDIVYISTCAGISDKNNKNISISNITTDVQLCLDNPDPDSDVVSDDGFVLMACDADNYLLYQEIIIAGSVLNNTLAWAHLQFDYFRYNTYFQQFRLNNSIEESLKVIPNKRQANVQCVICCDEEFDPEKLVKTVVGTGIVNAASINLFTDILTLEVLFEQNKDLVTNEIPVATDNFARTPINEPIEIDILAYASDSDGTLDPSTLTVNSGPSHGTAEVTVDYKILYTPDEDYTGPDLFTWNVKDNLGEVSNNATETLDVYQPAVASDDAFVVAKNRELFSDMNNLLTNDLGTGSLYCIAETKRADHGNVQIFENGTFFYFPDSNYVGDDTFDYTMKDINDDTDTGTVTITVFEPVPIFVKLVKENIVNSNVTDICMTGPKVTGTQTTKDFRAYFYSDMAGTIPLDVSGYGDDLLFNAHTVTNGSPSDSPDSKPISGVSLFIGNFKTDFLDNGCNGTLNYHRTFDINLLPSSDYTII